MKSLVYRFYFGRDSRISLLLVLSLFIFVGLACRGSRTDSETPSTSNTVTPSNTGTSSNPFSNSSMTGSNSTSSSPTTINPISTTKANAAKWEVPGDAEMQEISRTALMDFDDAVKAGNFSEFHTKISKTWQKQTTPETFNQAFGDFITKKVDISNVSSSTAKFSTPPDVEVHLGMKKLIAKGCYDISPRPVNFTLKWIPEGKDWKLFGLEVDTTAPCS